MENRTLKSLLEDNIIFCQHEEEAELICEIASSLGYKWKNGLSFKDTGWNIYKANTGYDFKKGVVNYVMFKRNNIINVKDVLKYATKKEGN